jgi:hypothetical protein
VRYEEQEEGNTSNSVLVDKGKKRHIKYIQNTYIYKKIITRS